MSRSAAGALPVGAIAISAAVNVSAVLPLFVTGALSVQLQSSLRFGRAGLGVAVAIFLGSAALTATPFGRLVERVGAPSAMRAAGVAAAVTTAAIAVTARSWAGLVIWLALGGMALALGESAGNHYLSQRVDRARLGLAFGLKQGALPLASLLGGLAVPAIALTVGWRWVYAAAALSAVVATLSVRGGREHSDPRQLRDARGGNGRGLAVLAAGVGLGFAAATTLATFTVDAAVTAGVGEGAAGLLLALGSATAIAVRLAVGRLADTRDSGHLSAVAALMGAGALGYGLLAINGPGYLVVGTLLAFGAGWGWSGLFFFAVARLDPATTGSSTGIVLTGGFLGSLTGPLLFGTLVDRASYSVGWVASAVLVALAAGAVLAAQRLLR